MSRRASAIGGLDGRTRGKGDAVRVGAQLPVPETMNVSFPGAAPLSRLSTTAERWPVAVGVNVTDTVRAAVGPQERWRRSLENCCP